MSFVGTTFCFFIPFLDIIIILSTMTSFWKNPKKMQRWLDNLLIACLWFLFLEFKLGYNKLQPLSWNFQSEDVYKTYQTFDHNVLSWQLRNQENKCFENYISGIIAHSHFSRINLWKTFGRHIILCFAFIQRSPQFAWMRMVSGIP